MDDVILQPVNVSPEELSNSAPRALISDCRRTELEDKLKRDAVGQTLRHAAVLNGPRDIPAQGLLAVSQATVRQRRPSDVLEQGSGFRCRGCLGCHVDSPNEGADGGTCRSGPEHV